jgi:hypothetical protein
MTKPSTPTKAELHEMLAEAVRNTQPQPVNMQLSRSATCSPIPSANGLATRNPRRNARPKSKAFVHLLAVSGNLDNAGDLLAKPPIKLDPELVDALLQDSSGPAKTSTNAKELAGQAIDALADPGASSEERAERSAICSKVLRNSCTFAATIRTSDLLPGRALAEGEEMSDSFLAKVVVTIIVLGSLLLWLVSERSQLRDGKSNCSTDISASHR